MGERLSVLLCDYGEVLTLPMPAGDRRSLERLGLGEGVRDGDRAGDRDGGRRDGGDRDNFWRSYWAHRRPYDKGELSTGGYWSLVLGHEPAASQLQALLQADVAAWLHPNAETLAATARAASRGWRLGVLSNAPLDHAEIYDRQPWLAPFSPRLFSARLGLVKPDPAVYAAALQAIGAAPSQVLFVDDRAENVEAARAAGLRAEVFTAPEQLDELTASSG